MSGNTATESEFEPGSGGGGGFAKHVPEKTKLELEEEKLKELLAEKDRFAGCPSNNVEYLYVLSQIERCKAKISILSRVTPTKPVDTSAEEGMCMLCYENRSAGPDVLEGCHIGFCLECFTRLKNDSRMKVRPIGYYGEEVFLNAAKCPFCRDVIADKRDTSNLRLAKIFMRFKKLLDANDTMNHKASLNNDFPLMSDLRKQKRQLLYEESHELIMVLREIEAEEKRRVVEETQRREEASRIEHERNSRLNMEIRDGIIARVWNQENLRCMISRGEALPPGTVLTPMPLRLNCCTVCQIPQVINPNQKSYAEFRADVLVNEHTQCTVCHNYLFKTLEQQAIDAFRAEEERRVNDIYQAALADQELHQLTTTAFNRRAFLFAEMEELEKPLRERLEQELLAAGGNEKACEMTMARFERELEEAQRKQNRRNRRK